MNIEELRPHIQSRLAHELGLNFIDYLSITLKRRLQEHETYIDTTFFNEELSNQARPKITDTIMDAVMESAKLSGHAVSIRDTKPKGYTFVEMTTQSCYLMAKRTESSNTDNAAYYSQKTLCNVGLQKAQLNDDLFNVLLIQDDIPLEDMLFVSISIFWHHTQKILDVKFQLPSPNLKRPIMEFSIDDLRESARKPMTNIAEEPIITIKKRLDDSDNQEKTG